VSIRRRDLVVIGLVAVAARLAFLLAFGGLDNELHDSLADQPLYIELASNLAEGNGFVLYEDHWVADAGEPTSVMPPLYPLFLGGIFAIFGEDLLAVRVIQILLSASLALLAYAIGSAVAGRPVGLIAGLLTALYPPLLMYARPIMSEAIFLPLIAGLVWLTIRWSQRGYSRRTAIAWGVVAGLAILTRTEAAILAALLLLWLGSERRAGLLACALGAATVAALLMPYSAYNWSAHGTLAPIPNARWKLWDHTWWAAMRERPEWQGVLLPERQVVPAWESKTELERDSYLGSMATDFILENPGTYLRQRASKANSAYPLAPVEFFRSSYPPDGAPYGSTSLDDVVRYSSTAERIRVWSFRLVFVLALAGFALRWRDNRFVVVLALVVVWNVLHSTVFVGSERLRLQIDVVLLVLAATCLVSAFEAVMHGRKSRLAIATPRARTFIGDSSASERLGNDAARRT
jgi:4-amino-4-deoxy-L-arabinose transferase-like glycosyltransferase